MPDPETWLRWLQEVTEPEERPEAALALRDFGQSLERALEGDESPEADSLRAALPEAPVGNWGDPLVREMGSGLLARAEAIGWRPAAPVAVGCLELDPGAGGVLEAPAGGFAVVLTRGFLTFANLMAKAVAAESSERLAELLEATVLLDNPLAAPPRLLVGRPEAALLLEGAERFALGSLLCLAMRDDLPSMARVPWALRQGVEVKRLAAGRQALFEADLMALQLLDPPDLWGVEVLLLGLSLVEGLRGAEEAPGFLPARLRRLFLHEAARRHLGEGVLDLWSGTEARVQAMWEGCRDRFTGGDTPSPRGD